MFAYDAAFSRNIGWVTGAEQKALRGSRIAIAGLGGVGGSHLLTLTRLGVGSFHIADLDSFDIPNLNRQAGASMASLGEPKVDVLSRLAKAINPELNVKPFPNGLTAGNADEFFSDIDLYMDGLDFFAFSARSLAFAVCARRGIPAVTAAPLGMGVASLVFMPGKMTFEQYFGFAGCSDEEKALRFLLGLSPAMLHSKALVDPSAIDLGERRGPSTAMACDLCAGVAATQALKILLKRGKVFAAPRGFQFDAYSNKFRATWRPGGINNPLQRLSLAVAKRRMGAEQAMNTATKITKTGPETSAIEQILDLARWAPSGDNTQVWRFEITGPDHFVVHGFDTREHVVYDFDGHPSQIAIGALLETISIAASGLGLRAVISRREAYPESTPTFDIGLEPAPGITADPLIPYIPRRSVQRRMLKTRPLSRSEKDALEAAVGPGHRVVWLETLGTRIALARLLQRYGKLRLTMPEAFPVHRDVIQWKSRFSEDKVPDQAVGLDPLTTNLMRPAMQSWGLIHFLNTYLGGTLVPRLELDLLPAIFCGAHFILVAGAPPAEIDHYVAAGRALQRFWLTATRLDLRLQPEYTPLTFAYYTRRDIRFTKTDSLWNDAGRLQGEFETLVGADITRRAVFMGRIGAGPAAQARSLRKPVEKLLRS
jgi:sulfur-carrier protein adenylyltransferase/sulfurtransferase